MSKLYVPEIQYLLDVLEEVDIKGYDKTHLIRHEEVTDKLEGMLDETI